VGNDGGRRTHLGRVGRGAVIALWLGHADIRSTNVYLHADMTIKQRALDLTTPASIPPGRYRPTDSLVAFLESL
jgi:integrase/recombinase XerC